MTGGRWEGRWGGEDSAGGESSEVFGDWCRRGVLGVRPTTVVHLLATLEDIKVGMLRMRIDWPILGFLSVLSL